MQLITTDTVLLLPLEVFACPICNAQLAIDVDEWEEADDGTWQVSDSGLHLDCTTEPDLDSEEWEEWHWGHWSTPYIDWLPLEEPVRQWVNARYRWQREEHTPCA